MLLLSAHHALVRVRKARSIEQQKVEDALARQERQLRLAFKAYVDDARSARVMREVAQLLEVRDIGGALKYLDKRVAAFGKIIPKGFTEAALSTFHSVGQKLNVNIQKARTPAVNAHFDPSNSRAASLMRQSELQFVQGLTDGQREATRAALADAFQSGASTRQAAKAFRDSIGLTKTQLDAVNSYEDALRNGSRSALDRLLRDRRFDSSVESAADSGDVLGGSKIDRMVDRYRENMLNYRAENIARTESLSVVSQARYEATQQIVEQVGLDPSDVTRTWNATKDKRTRDSHWAMDGQTVGMDEPYTAPSGEELMYPGDPDASAEERINCRCTETINIG